MRREILSLFGLGFLVLVLGCGSGSDDSKNSVNTMYYPPVQVDVSAYDLSCATNDECVAVRACVCNCPPVVDTVIRKVDQASFEQTREGIECEDHYDNRNSLYGSPGEAACVDNRCAFGPGAVSPDSVEPPEDWDRTCFKTQDCRAVPLNPCVTQPACGPYIGVAKDEISKADLWNSACDSFTHNECPDGWPRVRSYCEAGQCEAVESAEPNQSPACADFTNRRDCRVAGCGLVDVPAFTLADGKCELTLVPVCFGNEPYFANNHEAQAYTKGDTAMLFHSGFQDWSTCNGFEGPCACLDPSRTEFPGALSGPFISEVELTVTDTGEPCQEPGFRGRIFINNLSVRITPEDAGTTEVRLTRTEAHELRGIVLNIPPKQSTDDSCASCKETTLRIGQHTVDGSCCGSCDPEFGNEFAAVANYIEGLVQP